MFPTTIPRPVPQTEWDLFLELLPSRRLDDLDPRAAQAVYTPWVVTWLLIYQRLHGNATLSDAVSEFTLRFPRQSLPERKRIREHTLSANTGAYSLARTNLDRRVLYQACDGVFESLVDSYPPSWRGRRAFILDGTTVQLAPSPALQAAFPPASNQHGRSHWPILHLAVAHELASGLAPHPEFGPMYGPEAVSELTLSCRLLARLPERSILLADRNFGVFAFAWAALAAKHDVLVRLARGRFLALRKQAEPIRKGKWKVTWRPSVWDRKAHPELPEGAVISGWLHEVKVSEELTLWLFTTLIASGRALARLYHQRQDVETDIRDLKETLLLGQMTGRGVGMVEKEVVAALVAYNLASQVRRVAAARLKIEPRRLSFAGVWSLLKAFMGNLLEGKPQAEAEFERLLRAAGQRKLPNRKKQRSYPREVLPRSKKFPPRKRSREPVPQ